MSALLASACGGRIDFSGGLTGPSEFGAFAIDLANYPELSTVGGIAVISGAPIPMAAVRVDAATYSVYSLVCPHAGSTVAPNGSGFRCPNHGALWNASGTWIGGQRTSGLTPLHLTLDATAGILTVQGSGGNVDLTILLADFPALAPIGGIARVDRNSNIPIGVAHLDTSSYKAYGLACPHEGTIIDPANGQWRCPRHGARFAANGSLLQGPARTGLTALSVSLDSTGESLHIQGTAVSGSHNRDDG
jgi:Rieske Fe-S protein